VNTTGITKAATKTKVYYVIQSTVGWYFSAPERAQQALRPQDALQFSSVGRALSAYREAYRLDFNSKNIPWGAQLVRVEEAPGTRTLRLVSTRVIDAAKPVVIFDTETRTYSVAEGSTIGDAPSLQEATVYPDLGEAITAIAVNQDATDEEVGYTSAPYHIHQVEYVTTEPTVTETVLQ
jgi:hypothetical protein